MSFSIVHKKSIQQNRKWFLIFMLSLSSFAFSEPKLNLYTGFDIGRLENGYDIGAEYDASETFLIRNYVNVGYNNQIDEKSLLSIGVGGVMWKPYEKKNDAGAQQYLSFGPGISHAFMKYSLSESMHLNVGYMPYKYNDRAQNLGEYLFRSEAYPTIIYTGGWNWMNSASYNTFGLRLNISSLEGSLQQDIALFAEYFSVPIFDLTPAYLIHYKPTNFIKLGGAVSWHRAITPSNEVREAVTKKYGYYKNLPVPASPNRGRFRADNTGLEEVEYNAEWASGETITEAAIRQQIFDNADAVELLISGVTSPDQIILDTLSYTNAKEAFLYSGLKEDLATFTDTSFLATDPAAQATFDSISFSTSAIKLMAYFDLDLRSLMGFEAEELGNFNLYGEVALLGTKNYPIFYTEASQRLVKMFGFSLPLKFGGLNILDHFSIEVEHLPNPNAESIKNLQANLQVVPFQDDRLDAENKAFKVWNSDDFKWSINASRKMGPMSFFIQFANDHLRLKDGGTTEPSIIPVTNKPSHWYWLTRIEWSM